MLKPQYEAIEPYERTEIEAAVQRNDPSELLKVVLSVALHEEDREFAEAFCLRFAHHENFNVRGNAILGFGHIARLHGQLQEDVIKPLILSRLNDESEYVRGHASDAKDDMEWFLKWRF